MKESMTIYRDDKIVRATFSVKEIYRSLANDLLHKKVHKCTYIRAIKDRTNYDGTRTIKVYYTDGVKRVYVIEG